MHMLETLISSISQHALISTYFSVMVFNESAILAAFSFVPQSDSALVVGVAAAAVAGSLTNDLILYALARYGVSRFVGASEEGSGAESFFERWFLSNIFLTLFFIKFLFGIRLVLTVYLVVKKRVPLGKFIAYDFLGIIFYVTVIGGLGLLVGLGNDGVEASYAAVIRTVTAILILLFISHAVKRLIRWRKMEKIGWNEEDVRHGQ